MTLLDSKEETINLRDRFELERLRKKFGRYSDEAIQARKSLWQEPISAYNNLRGEPTAGKIVHLALYKWCGPPDSEKEDLVSVLEKYPEEKQEVQDFAQWILRERGLKDITLYRGGHELTDARIRAWSSVSEDQSIAPRAFAQPAFATGTSDTGFAIGVKIPIENIFTFYAAHPGFRSHLPEKEFILNERGVKGGVLVSVNGHEPSQEKKATFLKLMPDLE
jgi:hypothetical protein